MADPRSKTQVLLDQLHASSVADRAWQLTRLVRSLTLTSDLELGLVRRVLLHAAIVGAIAGLLGAAFFASLELLQQLLLEGLAGYVPLRARGEVTWWPEAGGTYRPWLLAILPGLGGLAAGLLVRWAPEITGGGTDAVIRAYHHGGGILRRRVIVLKALASLATLGTGGAGGREGPTMQIGGAVGSLVARLLGVNARERRLLLLVGVAAGISAVFRTPLGAALLAVEVLYEDGIESEALVPCILSSVVAYSIVISIFGESTLLAHAARYPFVPTHLPLYVLLAVVVSAAAALFTTALRVSQVWFARSSLPAFARPAAGGLLVGGLAVLAIAWGQQGASSGRGLGILGGGYGAVQLAISGGSLVPEGWAGVRLLVALGLVKGIAAALTIGSGGSAGDFAPSLAIGGVLGGAFGRTAAILLGDPRIDPGAFALVGMATFYGGIAHAPLAALVLVCELAGSYDLLVPLMMAEGVAFLSLRRRSLYEAQVPTLRDSPVHQRSLPLKPLLKTRVADWMLPKANLITFPTKTPVGIIFGAIEGSDQEVFPVLGANGAIRGLISEDAVQAIDREDSRLFASDLMQRPAFVFAEDDLATAARAMIRDELRALPVLDEEQRLLGLIDQADIARAYAETTTRENPTEDLPGEDQGPVQKS